jgi:hypothetical protein
VPTLIVPLLLPQDGLVIPKIEAVDEENITKLTFCICGPGDESVTVSEYVPALNPP